MNSRKYQRMVIDGIEYKLIPVGAVDRPRKKTGRPNKLDTNDMNLLQTLVEQNERMKQQDMADLYGVSMSTMTRALRKARKVACQNQI